MQTIVTSRRNPRIIEARKLDQRKHRLRQGRFLVEGLEMLEMALAAGIGPLEVFYCEELLLQGTGNRGLETGHESRSAEDVQVRATRLLQRLAAAGGELVAVSADVMGSLAEREAAEGVLAVFPLLEASLDEVRLAGGELVVVVDRLQDPGNLGTIIRTADAVGAAALVLIEPCVDPFDPKAVRGTMGSLFNLPLVRTSEVAILFDWLKARGVRILGADARRGVDWGAGLWVGSVSLVLGNEARGLSADVERHVQAWVRLPMVGLAESLNVAVAGGVLMYAWLRENLP